MSSTWADSAERHHYDGPMTFAIRTLSILLALLLAGLAVVVAVESADAQEASYWLTADIPEEVPVFACTPLRGVCDSTRVAPTHWCVNVFSAARFYGVPVAALGLVLPSGVWWICEPIVNSTELFRSPVSGLVLVP